MKNKSVNKEIPVESPQANGDTPRCLLSRRDFLIGSASVIVMISVPIRGVAQEIPAQVATYPRKRIARLSDLKQDVPFDFNYPDEKSYSASFLIKLGREAGGGISNDRDVVAFNYTCTHQGGPMQGSYKPTDKVLGPCPLHLTTYDLTRHGIVAAGNAYQSLPQVLLELDGDDVYAVGIFGLIYGRYDNLQA